MSTVSHNDRARPQVAGKTIFDYADELEVEVATSCLRSGECHECVVEVAKGMEALGERTENERYLRGKYRLACQARVVRDSPSIVFSPLRRRPRIVESSRYHHGRPTEFHPAVTRAENQVRYGDTVVDRYRRSICGLAIDLGTTTVVVELVDLETAAVLGGGKFRKPSTVRRQRCDAADLL